MSALAFRSVIEQRSWEREMETRLTDCAQSLNPGALRTQLQRDMPLWQMALTVSLGLYSIEDRSLFGKSHGVD